MKAQPFMQRCLQAIVNRNDLVLAALIVVIIFMMILPLPTWLVDAVIALNMCLSAVLLMVAMYLPSPLAFSSFPSVLLVTTLFRLSISIATTRLILLDGDAGHIIETFGHFVVGGNLIVGLVVFLILTIVQFIVITKGAERVAEVGARFTLDGREHRLTPNAGAHCIHGGPRGARHRAFDAQQTDAQTLVLRHRFLTAEDDFPGTLDLRLTYRLDDDNALVIEHEATALGYRGRNKWLECRT